MLQQLQTVLCRLLGEAEQPGVFHLFDPAGQLDGQAADEAHVARNLNAAFLIAVAGPQHPAAERANTLLDRMADSAEWGAVAGFYRNGIELIGREIEAECGRDPIVADRLRELAQWVSTADNLRKTDETQEKLWSVFFPEATGIRSDRQLHVERLRRKRRVDVAELDGNPIRDPARQVLFTSNVLLTVPADSGRLADLGFSEQLTEQLRLACDEPQLYWYDHPIQIGVEPDANEVLYGLRGLETALRFERERGNAAGDARLTCVLSVSVTHRGLQGLAKRYLVEEFARAGGFPDLDVFVFTEEDTQRIVDEVLVPAAERYSNCDDPEKLLGMFGVDGRYGRHYSFLKAIAAFWNVLIDPETKATIKIDLDQVFPQEELVQESGHSAFEHFTTPLWGASGVGANGRRLELGMIAGALVNERDIGDSLFTPDVRFPRHEPTFDECLFFSALPQALSTQAEMMTRYDTDSLDGRTGCIHRVHVTGGTNGILVDSLRRHRPFTPSFIGRAEDQAYILSALAGEESRLAYVHKPGLIMRHDKEAFAQEAIAAAQIGKLIGDYERILYFSAYADVLAGDARTVKELADPFTGCFISRIPITVVHLRFALKAAALFAAGKADQAQQFIMLGTRRIADALNFVRSDDGGLDNKYQEERRGWDIYYDLLDVVESAQQNGDPFAAELCRKAKQITDACLIGEGKVE